MIRKTVKKILQSLSANGYQTLNRIEVDRSRLLSNANYFKQQYPGDALIPVLKSNAYGHGLLQIAKILNDTDCAFLAVDGYFEAAQIRDITRHPILVLGYIRPENAHLLDTKRCSFVVQDIFGLQVLAALRRPVRIHLEIDTGMHRLGLQAYEVEDYLSNLKKYPQLKLEGVMTHLADADNPQSDAYTNMQLKSFDQLAQQILQAGFKPDFFHVAQTAGSLKTRSQYTNAIRVGIGLYGINPLDSKDKHFQELSNLQPVLQLKSTIIKTYHLKKGDRVSYNGIFTAPGPMRIGILPLGYYEGLPRQLSNNGVVTSGEFILPILGRICMNHTTIDLTGTKLDVGDEVTVISLNSLQPNSIQQASAAHGIFTYEWLTNLASSVKRVTIHDRPITYET